MTRPSRSNPSTSAPLVVVSGSSARLRQRAVDRIVASHLDPSEREWGLVVLDLAEVGVESAVEQMGGGSLMAARRVLVLRRVEKLTPSAQKILAKALGGVTPGTCVVLDVESAEEGRRRGTSLGPDLTKVIEAHGQLVQAEVPQERELAAWVAQEVAALGKRMSGQAARVFVELAGTHVDALLNELEKLVTYVGPEVSEITPEDVTAVVTGERESTVFALVDAIGRRDVREALSVLPRLIPASGAQGAAIPVVAMIARQLRLIWQARVLSRAGLNLESGSLPEEWAERLPGEHNFMEATRGRRFLVRKYVEQSRHFNDVQLVRAMVRVYETDLALKGQGEERMDDRLALETLIVSLCSVR